uniref:Ig-like domain-containing protein n=1 Tax=Monopterus albus TaxID=43700 RepID=A0A3Q3I9X7_MONAL
MKMKVSELLLVLFCALCICADVVHEDIKFGGCSDSDAEEMFGLEGEEQWYADFVNNRGVDALPDFVDHFTFPGLYEFALSEREQCRQNLKKLRAAYKDLPLELDTPSGPVVYPRDDVELGEKNTLTCYVTGFYPAPVKVYWTRNGDNVTEGMYNNVPFMHSFNQISRLEFTPQLGDIYSCTVEHPALSQPLTKIWDVEVQQPSVGPAVFCGLGLTVGLLGVAAGTFFLIKGIECR